MKLIINTLVVLVLSVFSTSSAEEPRSAFVPNINAIEAEIDGICSIIIVAKGIRIESIKSIEISSSSIPVSYALLPDDFEKILVINNCGHSELTVDVYLNNGTKIRKDISFNLGTREKFGYIAKKTLRNAGKLLRSNDFLRVLVKLEDFGAPTKVVRAIRSNRNGLANKLDEISNYVDTNSKLVEDQIANYLRAVGVSNWIAKWAAWAFVAVVL